MYGAICPCSWGSRPAALLLLLLRGHWGLCIPGEEPFRWGPSPAAQGCSASVPRDAGLWQTPGQRWAEQAESSTAAAITPSTEPAIPVVVPNRGGQAGASRNGVQHPPLKQPISALPSCPATWGFPNPRLPMCAHTHVCSAWERTAPSLIFPGKGVKFWLVC